MKEITVRLPDHYFGILERLAKAKEVPVEELAKLFLIDKLEEELFLENVRRGEV